MPKLIIIDLHPNKEVNEGLQDSGAQVVQGCWENDEGVRSEIGLLTVTNRQIELATIEQPEKTTRKANTAKKPVVKAKKRR